MSLSQRVRENESGRLVSKRGQEDPKSAYGVDELRDQVSKRVSLDSLASMLASSPKRARNELRAVCRQVLCESHWQVLTAEEKEALTDNLIDVIVGMGPVEGLLKDERVTEVMVNGSKNVFFEMDGKLFESDIKFTSDDQVRVLIDRIIGPLGRRIDESSPMVDARLPEGHRVNAVIPPIAIDGPHLTIRTFTRKVMTLEQMEEVGTLGADVSTLLRWCIALRKSIVVSGGTGSGKTTLLNSLSLCLPKGERIVTIEDSAELRFLEHEHVVRLEARPKNSEGTGEVTIRDLVINALRMRPDRIVVGEVRSAEALDMLQAMSTGHDGSLTTIHSRSTEDVIERMVTLVRYGMDLPVEVIEAQIASAFDVIVQLRRAPGGGRYLSEVSEVAFDRDSQHALVRRIYDRDGMEDPGRWLEKPSFAGELRESQHEGIDHEEVERWLGQAFGE